MDGVLLDGDVLALIVLLKGRVKTETDCVPEELPVGRDRVVEDEADDDHKGEVDGLAVPRV